MQLHHLDNFCLSPYSDFHACFVNSYEGIYQRNSMSDSKTRQHCLTEC